jgi:hypothetical protein
VYEHVSEPILPRRLFVLRFARHAAAATLLLVGSLAVGAVGYAVLDGLSWVDAFLNASMILGGMGPVDPLRNDVAKVFAGLYALYSGVIFLVAVGIVFAPLLHRILHRLHLQALPADDDPDSPGSPGTRAGSTGNGTGSTGT